MMRFAVDLLKKSGIGEPRLTVDLLLSHALKCPRIDLYAAPQRQLQKEELRAFRLLLERRLNREPVQYIVGSVNFMGLQLAVDSRVFIPRPETETLVEQVMLSCRESSAEDPVSILEIGTGSGNISIALAKFVRGARVTTLDVSPEALDVARQNAHFHRVEESIEFHQLDVFEPIDQILRRRWHVLVSNPPYVSRDAWEALPTEIRKYEPRVATSDWADGLTFYRRIVELAPLVLRDGGTMFLEIGCDQTQAVRAIMADGGVGAVTVAKDLDGHDRVMIGTVRSRSRNMPSVN
jgi:release factor glutamine methyltransferase